MKLSLYTFSDEAFVPGIVALINSVRRHGFSGKIYVGSPEPLSISQRPPEGIELHSLGLNGYWPGNRKAELGDFSFGMDGEWSKSRMVWTQVQNAQPNNLDQFRDGTAQPIVWPPEAKTGTLIYPYERARQK